MEDLIDYLNARIKALENRVEFLEKSIAFKEGQVEVLKIKE
jgi:uncharacterized coiled-coil protein SlyX